MFDSGVIVQDLIDEIKNEADIAITIPDKNYIQWLNSVEQLLYSEIIQEQKKYEFGKYSSLIKTKINHWPLFDSQTVGDMDLTVTEDGKYVIKSNRAVSTATNAGGDFTKTITLPTGTYTISDNSLPYSASMPQGLNRTLVTDATTGAVLANISVLSEADASDTFTLTEDTAVNLTLRVQQYVDLSRDGHVYYPQLELGSDRTPFVTPIVPADIVCELGAFEAEDAVRFEDIHAVYADKTQLIKSTLTSGVIFPHSYFKDGDKLCLHTTAMPDKFTVVYIVRPELKKANTASEAHVMVPVEFIDLVKAKLRGEAYKLANEGELAAVWLNDYNNLLETFKAWISGKKPEFGM